MGMTQKWEQKKKSGNVLKKEARALSQEETELQMYQDQLEAQRKGNENSALYTKIQCGQKLTSEEEAKLKELDPKAYMEYKADQIEQEAYEKKLSQCKTKEEAERLHVNKLQSNLSKLKSIVNNPNIPKSEKIKEAQRIQGDTTVTVRIFHEFTLSETYKNMPTEEELKEKHQEGNANNEHETSDNTSEMKIIDSETDTEAVDENISESDRPPVVSESLLQVEKEVVNEIKNKVNHKIGPDEKHHLIDVLS